MERMLSLPDSSAGAFHPAILMVLPSVYKIGGAIIVSKICLSFSGEHSIGFLNKSKRLCRENSPASLEPEPGEIMMMVDDYDGGTMMRMVMAMMIDMF